MPRIPLLVMLLAALVTGAGCQTSGGGESRDVTLAGGMLDTGDYTLVENRETAGEIRLMIFSTGQLAGGDGLPQPGDVALAVVLRDLRRAQPAGRRVVDGLKAKVGGLVQHGRSLSCILHENACLPLLPRPA